jgi:hypothetical protein
MASMATRPTEVASSAEGKSDQAAVAKEAEAEKLRPDLVSIVHQKRGREMVSVVAVWRVASRGRDMELRQWRQTMGLSDSDKKLRLTRSWDKSNKPPASKGPKHGKVRLSLLRKECRRPRTFGGVSTGPGLRRRELDADSLCSDAAAALWCWSSSLVLRSGLVLQARRRRSREPFRCRFRSTMATCTRLVGYN